MILLRSTELGQAGKQRVIDSCSHAALERDCPLERSVVSSCLTGYDKLVKGELLTKAVYKQR